MVFAVSSCKKGCSDPNASNYDPKVKQDDGTCTYSDPSGSTSITLGIDCATTNGIDFSVGTAECPACDADTNGVSTDIRFTKNNWEIVAGDTCWGKDNLAIASVGSICCLGQILEIPTSGFTDKIPPAEKDGYVIKTREGNHARLFLDHFLFDSFGAVSGAEVRFQYPFEP